MKDGSIKAVGEFTLEPSEREKGYNITSHNSRKVYLNGDLVGHAYESYGELTGFVESYGSDPYLKKAIHLFIERHIAFKKHELSMKRKQIEIELKELAEKQSSVADNAWKKALGESTCKNT